MSQNYRFTTLWNLPFNIAQCLKPLNFAVKCWDYIFYCFCAFRNHECAYSQLAPFKHFQFLQSYFYFHFVGWWPFHRYEWHIFCTYSWHQCTLRRRIYWLSCSKGKFFLIISLSLWIFSSLLLFSVLSFQQIALCIFF